MRKLDRSLCQVHSKQLINGHARALLTPKSSLQGDRDDHWIYLVNYTVRYAYRATPIKYTNKKYKEYLDTDRYTNIRLNTNINLI